MTTLLDYAATHFPNHVMEPLTNDSPLTAHTTVAHVIGADHAAEMEREVRNSLPGTRVGVVLVRPTPPHILRHPGPGHGEDPEGIFDLPMQRLVAAGAIGAVLAGAAAGIAVGIITDSIGFALIAGMFAAVLGGATGAMMAGGGRYGGDRAWEQSHQPVTTVALVAAFANEETTATSAALVMETLHPHDIRIVNEHGAWHSPHT